MPLEPGSKEDHEILNIENDKNDPITGPKEDDVNYDSMHSGGDIPSLTNRDKVEAVVPNHRSKSATIGADKSSVSMTLDQSGVAMTRDDSRVTEASTGRQIHPDDPNGNHRSENKNGNSKIILQREPKSSAGSFISSTTLYLDKCSWPSSTTTIDYMSGGSTSGPAPLVGLQRDLCPEEASLTGQVVMVNLHKLDKSGRVSSSPVNHVDITTDMVLHTSPQHKLVSPVYIHGLYLTHCNTIMLSQQTQPIDPMLG